MNQKALVLLSLAALLGLCFSLLAIQPVAAATPTPVASETGQLTRGLPVLGILILLAPAAWLVWQRSRPGFSPQIKAAGCLPVIDEQRSAHKD